MVRNTVILLVFAALLKGFGFLLNLVMARELTAAQYGIWGLAYSTQNFIATFAVVGIPEVVISSLKDYRKDNSKEMLFSSANICFSVTLLFSVAFAYSLYFFSSYNPKFKINFLLSVVITGAFLAFATIQSQMLRLQEKHLSSLIFSFLLPFLGLIGCSLAMLMVPTVENYFLGSALGLVGGGLIFKNRIQGTIFSKETLQACIGLIKKLPPFVLIAFFGWITGYGTNIVIGQAFNLNEVGKFTFIFNLNAVLVLISTSLNQVWGPRFFKLIQNNSDMVMIERKNRIFFTSLSLLLGSICAIIIVFNQRICETIGGNVTQYANLRLEMLLIFCTNIAAIPYCHCLNYHLVFDKGILLMRTTIFSSLLGLLLWGFFMFYFGAIGIYVGVFTQIILRSIFISWNSREWKVNPCWTGVICGIAIGFLGFYIAAR